MFILVSFLTIISSFQEDDLSLKYRMQLTVIEFGLGYPSLMRKKNIAILRIIISK